MLHHLSNCHGEINLIMAIVSFSTFLLASVRFYFVKIKRMFKNERNRII